MRATVPEKLLRLLRVIVEFPLTVASTVCELGLAVTLKSIAVIVTVAACDSELLVPVIVTV